MSSAICECWGHETCDVCYGKTHSSTENEPKVQNLSCSKCSVQPPFGVALNFTSSGTLECDNCHAEGPMGEVIYVDFKRKMRVA